MERLIEATRHQLVIAERPAWREVDTEARRLGSFGAPSPASMLRWFRLQDRSRLSKTSVANVYLATYSVADGNHSGTEVVKDAGNHVVRFEIKGQSANNPLNKELLGGFRCIDGL